MTRGGKLEQVWEGIAEADRVGLHPIKLNAVVVRGLNDDEVPQLAALTLQYRWEMRFIEVMPLTGVADVAQDGVVKSEELIAQLEAIHGPLEPLGLAPTDSARRFRIPGAKGKLGFISSVSDPFCATCNRMRLTADGRLHLCLLRDDEVDLRAAHARRRDPGRDRADHPPRGRAQALGPRPARACAADTARHVAAGRLGRCEIARCRRLQRNLRSRIPTTDFRKQTLAILRKIWYTGRG